MEVTRIESRLGPEAGRCRLEADLVYGDGESETLWFEYPDAWYPELNLTGDPWLAALTPLALQLGEPLILPRPVDATLLRGLHQAAQVWRTWFPDLAPFEIEADVRDDPPPPATVSTASLFSGGVDSWYAALINPDEAAAGKMPRIDTLLLAWGADLRLHQTAEFRAVEAPIARVAAQLGFTFASVATNLRDTRWALTNWAEHSHGAFFAAMAHGAGRFRHLIIPSSVTYNFPKAWGSHPLTDPMLSSRAARIIYHAAEINRLAKVGFVSREPLALEQLRVCWRSGTERNCGRCGKCLRTMIGLELHGALSRSPTFPYRTLDPELASRLLVDTPLRIVQLDQMRSEALRQGRSDLFRALSRARRRSRVIRTVGPLLGRLDQAGVRGAFRLRRWLERGMIRE